MIAFIGELVGQACGNVGDAPCLEGRLTTTETSLFGAATDRTYGNLRSRVHLFRSSIQLEQKSQIVREHDDLSVRRFRDQPLGNGLAVHVVERGHRIVKYDAGFVLGRGEFRHERGQGDASMLALAQDLPHRCSGLASQRNLEAWHALHAVLLAQLDGKPCNLETRHLTRKLRAQRVRYQCLRNFRAFRSYAVGRGVALCRFERLDLFQALDLRQHVCLDAVKPLAIGKLGALGDQRLARRGIGLYRKRFASRIKVRHLIDQSLRRQSDQFRIDDGGGVGMTAADLTMTPEGVYARTSDFGGQRILTQIVTDGRHDGGEFGQSQSASRECRNGVVIGCACGIGSLLAVVAHEILEAIEAVGGLRGQFLLAQNANAAGIGDGKIPLGIGRLNRKGPRAFPQRLPHLGANMG